MEKFQIHPKPNQIASEPTEAAVIGHLHLLTGGLPQDVLRRVAQKYGPAVHLQLGEIFSVVVSSREATKQVMKGNNLACADRAGNIGTKIISYDNNDFIFSPYNAHWRQMRRICVSKLLSPRNLHSFGYIRRDEMSCLIESLRSSAGEAINLTEKIERKIDTFSAGTEISSTTVDWAMAELMRNPRVMAKVQEEVRWSLKGKMNVDTSDVQELKYLKVVVKETLRLHPPFPIIPRQCREEILVDGYSIPAKSRIMINVWSLGRDPQYWNEPEMFHLERFDEISTNFIGKDFEYIPFGAGRRICPGLNFGLTNVEVPLAQLLYHLDWKLPHGMSDSDMDMYVAEGLSGPIKNAISLVPTPYYPST